MGVITYPFLSFSCSKWLLLCTRENKQSTSVLFPVCFDSGLFYIARNQKSLEPLCADTVHGVPEFCWEQLQPNASTNGGRAVSAGPPCPPTFLENLVTFPKLQTEHRILSSLCHRHHLNIVSFSDPARHWFFARKNTLYPSVKVLFPLQSIHMQIRKQQLELDMEQQTGSK